MLPVLSLADKAAFSARLDQLREAHVLQGVEGHRVDASNGVIVCGCGDCDQIGDYHPYLGKIIHPRVHLLTLNGGALKLAPGSPLYYTVGDDGRRHEAGAVLDCDLRDSALLKSMGTVVLLAHVPCGAAMSVNMSVDQILEWLVKAKLEMKKRHAMRGYRFACFLHVDRRKLGIDRDPRTYFVSVREAMNWLAHPPALLTSSRFEETPTFAG